MKCPRVDLENVHVWTSARSTQVDISKCVHKCTLFATSTRGHSRGPRVDVAFQQGIVVDDTVPETEAVQLSNETSSERADVEFLVNCMLRHLSLLDFGSLIFPLISR